jgi:hypothetical protein
MNDIAEITDAGGMVGPSSMASWKRLIAEHGNAGVALAVADLHEETRQPVNVNKASQRLADLRIEGEQRAIEEAEDAAAASGEPASIDVSGAAPMIDLTGADALHATEKPPAPALAAPVAEIKLPLKSTATLIERVPAATAPTPVPKEIAMPKPTKPAPPKDATDQAYLDIAARVKQSLADQNLSQRDLGKQIGLSEWSVSLALRTGQFTRATMEKFNLWLTAVKPTGTAEVKPEVAAAAAAPIAFPAATTGQRTIRITKDTRVQPQIRLRTHYHAIDRLDALGVAILHLSRENPREAGIIASIYADLAEDIAAEEAATAGKDGGK